MTTNPPSEEISKTEDRCSVVPTSRSVLEHKLLSALDDSSKVAILATKEDLDLFIHALEDFRVQGFPSFRERATTFANDLRQLRAEAFG